MRAYLQSYRALMGYNTNRCVALVTVVPHNDPPLFAPYVSVEGGQVNGWRDDRVWLLGHHTRPIGIQGTSCELLSDQYVRCTGARRESRPFQKRHDNRSICKGNNASVLA